MSFMLARGQLKFDWVLHESPSNPPLPCLSLIGIGCVVYGLGFVTVLNSSVVMSGAPLFGVSCHSSPALPLVNSLVVHLPMMAARLASAVVCVDLVLGQCWSAPS